METILEVRDLSTSFATKSGEVQAVRGIGFSVRRGEVLGIVGESGSGKSVTSLSLLGVLPDNAVRKSGEAFFCGENLFSLSQKELRKIRGARISMIFQDPMTSLNPLMPIGKQMTEAIREHNRGMSREEADNRALSLLERVHIPDAKSRFYAYPHELSGGMRQRVMIAIALSCQPELLIADEPTTALDVTIQDQILNLIKEMQRELGLSVIFITHDLGVVAEICDRVTVMYGGLVMEEGDADSIFSDSLHPYTEGLMASVPRLDQDKSRRLIPIHGSPPDMLLPPVGCPFWTRCRHAMAICKDELPPLFTRSEGRQSRCWLLHPDAPSGNPYAASQQS